MKRTTVFIDESTERALERLAQRRGESKAALIREALGEYLSRQRGQGPRELGFVAAGGSGRGDVAERHEELLWQESADEDEEEAGGEEESGTSIGPEEGDPACRGSEPEEGAGT